LGALNSLLSWDSNLYSFPEASLVPQGFRVCAAIAAAYAISR
jgi:hypothetical protein